MHSVYARKVFFNVYLFCERASTEKTRLRKKLNGCSIIKLDNKERTKEKGKKREDINQSINRSVDQSVN